nr:reverse transcriptase domain-containing protein [Tanacetum cinerariifolium]
MSRECLGIIESKSKVRYSRNKPVVAKVSMTASTSGISPDVAELKDMVGALLLDKKGQSPTLVKAVEESCVTCRGAHSYRNCLATDGNNYHDNIKEFVSQATAVNFNQGNTDYRPPMMSNHIRPPGFPPVPNNQNLQRNNQNRFNPNQNQNRGSNFNQGPVYQPLVFQPPAYQAPVYQALAPQTQGVSKEDFSAYVKANDVVMRNMQTQGQNMQNQLTNLIDLIIKFMNSNTAFTSNSGTLPSNTIANPRSDLKAITTRSGVSYDGPQILPPPSSLPSVVENKAEATKDTVDPTNNENTKDVQPWAVHPKPVTFPISEPAITPVSASRPNPKASIPYPSRRNDERNRERAKDQIEKFYQIFKDMSFKISFADALMLMPKFSLTLKGLIENKEKLSEMARTLLNEHCSVVLLKKLPEKLGDPGKFLIPCDFPCMAECLALADLGASINLMPYSVWKRLSLSDLTPTCMTLELADHFDYDPRVPLILGRSFLKTGRAIIDVFEGSFRFFDTILSGNPISLYDLIVSATSPTLTPFGNSDFLLEEVDAFLVVEDGPTSSDFYQPYLDPEGDILLLEAFINDDPSLPPPNQRNYLHKVRKELKICKAHSKKSSVDEPLVAELKELPPHLEYAFLEGDDKLPVIIAKDLSVEQKTALITILKSHKRAIA